MNAHGPEPRRRELVIAAAAVWALLGVALAARGADLNPPPWKGREQPSTADPTSAERRAVVCAEGRGGIPADGFTPKFKPVRETALASPSPVPSLQGRGGSCRIYNNLPNGSTNIGSGTLIDVTPDRRRGLVLSCGHLFTEGTGRVIVEFDGGRTHGANVLAVDRNADLSALEIASPPLTAAAVSFDIDDSAPLTACGFGPSGQFRAITGRIVGAAQGDGQASLRMAGAVRSGDSGGGVFDQSGRLVAVVWGERGGETYASSGGPLRSFLERLTGRASARAASTALCPDGRCPLMGPASRGAAPAGQWPAAGGPLFGGSGSAIAGDDVAPNGDAERECPCDCDERLGTFATRLERIESAKQDRGDYLVRGQLDDYARTDQLALVDSQNRQRHQSLLGRIETLGPLVGAAGRVAVPAAAAALGISGPVGWAILAAASVGGGLLGRLFRKRSRVASHELRAGNPALETRNSRPATSQEATAAAAQSFRSAAAVSVDEQQPIERDDREARELLRLSQLEGRDPLQDALAGRLALDRLDALAESDADPHRARLADDLRRELRERFNEIAPTKFQVNAAS